MKRLFAIALSFFVSLFNNVDFMVNDQQPYEASVYYTIDEQDPPDYREYYGQTPVASNKYSCKTSNYSSMGKRVNLEGATSGFWFVDGVYKYENSLPNDKVYTFDSETYIIAPYDCVLESDSKTNHGDTMTVLCDTGDNKYRLSFKDIKCWYCDINRVNIEATKGFHTSEEQRGKTFFAGNVLCVAKDGSTVTVTKVTDSGKEVACSIADMYKNQ